MGEKPGANAAAIRTAAAAARGPCASERFRLPSSASGGLGLASLSAFCEAVSPNPAANPIRRTACGGLLPNWSYG